MSKKNKSPRRSKTAAEPMAVSDGYVNHATRTGQGTNNLTSRGNYSMGECLTRQPVTLEAMYRQSWVVGKVIDAVAEDMTREGIEISSDWTPIEIEQVQTAITDLQVWDKLREAICWGRLYGGAVAMAMIDGQDTATPLDPATAAGDGFKGLQVFDRWQMWPEPMSIVSKAGPDFGRPEYYRLMNPVYAGIMPCDADLQQGHRIHYSRLFFAGGIALPPRQKAIEQGWGLSVVERIYDRLVAFDSATLGVANLVYKAHLRVAKFDGLREHILSKGGKLEEAFMRNLEFIRLAQSNEGLTILDVKDDIQMQSYTFAGLDQVLLSFGEQLSGATGIPLTRLFGQSPAGLNSTGEGDLRTYYDNISSRRESDLRRPMHTLLELISWSKFGKPMPEGTSFEFGSLWEMPDTEKAAVETADATAVINAFEAGLIDQETALLELQQRGRVTGRWSNVTDEMITAARGGDVPVLGEELAELPS